MARETRPALLTIASSPAPDSSVHRDQDTAVVVPEARRRGTTSAQYNLVMASASYAVDIGVYNVGARGQILSSTTTAWARLSAGTRSFDDITYSGACESGEFSGTARRTWICGRSIKQLAARIIADIEAGFSVSLGLEAPMWFPIYQECAGQLFKPRFAAERGSEWYLQSGASAIVKAISIGTMLLGLLTSEQPPIALTTDPKASSSRTILLYEAFVAGNFKNAPPKTASRAVNEWDAFTASLAYGAVNWAFDSPPSFRPQELHEAGSSGCEIASVWQLVASLVPSKPPVAGPRDCQIVGMTQAVGKESSDSCNR